MSEMDPTVWLKTLYFCEKKETSMNRKTTTEGIGGDEAVAMRNRICHRRGYLDIAGTFMRPKWISPFDLYEATIWTNQRQIGRENPDESTQSVMTLGRANWQRGAKPYHISECGDGK